VESSQSFQRGSFLVPMALRYASNEKANTAGSEDIFCRDR
jgi:hypothetical protein